MKVTIIGGSGRIGTSLAKRLRARGHDVLAASRSSGVDALTGEGVAAALDGAAVVVDVSNSPSFADAAVLEFFTTSTRNLLEHGAAGVGHHVALSVVGTAGLPESGYLRAKLAQERLIERSSIPYSIVQATQFFEFIAAIADAATDGKQVRIPPVLFQPIAADDVAGLLAEYVLGEPLNGAVEIAGPDRFRFDECIRLALNARRDPREVVADPSAGYFGAALRERSLVPRDDARLGTTHLADFLRAAPR